MPDRVRTVTVPPALGAPPAVNSLAASAMIISAERIAPKSVENWQEDAWSFYDSVGELRFACTWLANAYSQVRLVAAKVSESGDEPEQIDDPKITEVLSMLCGGAEGQSQMLAALAIHLTVPGIGYLVGEVNEMGTTDWYVMSSDELRMQGSEYQTIDVSGKWRPLAEESLVVQVWRAHARNRWMADSPTRAVLPVLKELEMLAAHVDATTISRLAGAGLLLVPNEAVFASMGAVDPTRPVVDDPFVRDLVDAMVTPIRDRGSAAAVVPAVVKMPGSLIDKVTHLRFGTDFDDRVLELRDSAIKRLALGLDVPPEVLLGLGDVNHWSAWQIEESAIRMHVNPGVALIASAVTVGYFRPALQLAGVADPETYQVWYDTAALRTRPDKSQDALSLYDRLLVGAEATLRETGFADTDSPTDDELKRQVLLKVVTAAPSLAPIILPALGISLELPTDVAPLDPTGATGTPTEDGTPEDPNAPVSTNPGPPEQDPLLAAADQLVRRALERAGNRLRRHATRKLGNGVMQCESVEFHAVIGGAPPDTLDALLADAWENVPAVADRFDIVPEALCEMLDSYVRTLLATGIRHDYATLAAQMGHVRP